MATMEQINARDQHDQHLSENEHADHRALEENDGEIVGREEPAARDDGGEDDEGEEHQKNGVLGEQLAGAASGGWR